MSGMCINNEDWILIKNLYVDDGDEEWTIGTGCDGGG